MKLTHLVPQGDTTKKYKRLRFEVCVFHTNNENEVPDVIAKFKSYGDAALFASHIAKGNVYYESVVVR